MKIKKVNKVDDCLEATNARDLYIDKPIDKAFIDYLGTKGRLYYNDSFAKPYFKLIVRGKYTIKGAEGNKILRILLPDVYNDEDLKQLISYIENYS